MVDNFLEHHGIKGMKWGVRRENPSGGSKRSTPKASTLSDNELQARVKRLNLEKQYSDLVKKQNERDGDLLAIGLGVATSLVAVAGKQILGPIIKRKVQSYVEGVLGG